MAGTLFGLVALVTSLSSLVGAIAAIVYSMETRDMINGGDHD